MEVLAADQVCQSEEDSPGPPDPETCPAGCIVALCQWSGGGTAGQCLPGTLNILTN